jgi:hypothetical protein
MGGKHGKYVYVKRRDGWYVKVRVLKNREDNDPAKYIVVGPKVREAPYTYKIMEEDELPEEARRALYAI